MTDIRAVDLDECQLCGAVITRERRTAHTAWHARLNARMLAPQDVSPAAPSQPTPAEGGAVVRGEADAATAVYKAYVALRDRVQSIIAEIEAENYEGDEEIATVLDEALDATALFEVEPRWVESPADAATGAQGGAEGDWRGGVQAIADLLGRDVETLRKHREDAADAPGLIGWGYLSNIAFMLRALLTDATGEAAP